MTDVQLGIFIYVIGYILAFIIFMYETISLWDRLKVSDLVKNILGALFSWFAVILYSIMIISLWFNELHLWNRIIWEKAQPEKPTKKRKKK